MYRWWGERYNVLDTNEPGYVYQYPTTVEGSNLYQNAVALTQPMHLQDTKWIRTPYLPTARSSTSASFPGRPRSWTARATRAGTTTTRSTSARPASRRTTCTAAGRDRRAFRSLLRGDGKGQLEHYDGNDDKLIAYDTNYMPGNDADAITFGYPKTNAARRAPGRSSDPSRPTCGAHSTRRASSTSRRRRAAKVDEMADTADQIRDAVLDRLWSDETQMFLAGTSHGALSAASSGSGANPLSTAERDLIPSKESNLYDVYAEELVPFEDAEKYAAGFRFLRYGDNFPIFPFYTANQYDRRSSDRRFEQLLEHQLHGAVSRGAGRTAALRPRGQVHHARVRGRLLDGWRGASTRAGIRGSPTRRSTTRTGTRRSRRTTATTPTT